MKGAVKQGAFVLVGLFYIAVSGFRLESVGALIAMGSVMLLAVSTIVGARRLQEAAGMGLFLGFALVLMWPPIASQLLLTLNQLGRQQGVALDLPNVSLRPVAGLFVVIVVVVLVRVASLWARWRVTRPAAGERRLRARAPLVEPQPSARLRDLDDGDDDELGLFS